MAINGLDYTLEHALDKAVECLEEYMPRVIDAYNALDSQRPNPLYGAAGIPYPYEVTTTPSNDMGGELLTPGVYLTAETLRYRNYDASTMLSTEATLFIRIALSEADSEPEARVFRNVQTAYANIINYILATKYVDMSLPYGCAAGVQDCTPSKVTHSPMVRIGDSPVWLRLSETQATLKQSLYNQWDIADPTP